MSKKTKGDDVVVYEQGGTFEITAEVATFALSLGVDLTGTVIAERADLAAEHMSRSQRHMLAAGLLLASIKSSTAHGEFETLLADRGFEPRAAQRAMSYAQFISQQPAAERERLIGMPKYKVLALASADPEVIEALAASGENIDALSVRALQERIRELSAEVATKGVALETAQAEAKAAKKAAGRKDRAAEVPLPIFDIRAETVAQVERSRLAVDEVMALGRDLINLVDVEGLQEWLDPTARLAITGLLGLQVQIDGVVRQLVRGFELDGVKPGPMSYLTPAEVEEAAKRFADLVALHQHEKALRDWERQQERPRGKGRPSAKPEAPKTRGE